MPRCFFLPVSSLSDTEITFMDSSLLYQASKKNCIYHYILKSTLPGFDTVKTNTVFSIREIINNTLIFRVVLRTVRPEKL